MSTGTPGVYYDVHTPRPMVGGSFIQQFTVEADARIYVQTYVPGGRIMRVTVEEIT